MKNLILGLAIAVTLLLGSASIAEARVTVRSYFRRNGTYVQRHYRTSPNRLRYDNWSSWGNYNPYTGRRGYVRW